MQTVISRRDCNDNIELPEDIHPVLRRIYAARNIKTAKELDYSLKSLLPFHSFLGINEAVALLGTAVIENRRILVVADFDADGATSCALTLLGLSRMGAGNLNYVVPNRFEYGYGLSPELVDFAMQFDPELLITVDNGISSIEGVANARSKHVDVLITDHHLPGNSLPDANAILNPNQTGDTFPSKCLAGVGVMFYLLIALRHYFREKNWFEQKQIKDPNLAEFLDLVALGTVADMVPLDYNNRILVAQGLARIRNRKCRPGILALLNIARRTSARTTTQDLSFAVAPRLNAAGRLTDMSLGIECLLANETGTARKMALELDMLNQERQEIQADMQEQVMTDIDAINLDEYHSQPAGLCFFNGNWHQGVIGILAAKIKARLKRPVVVFARERADIIKGSARSIRGVHIRDVLDTIASQHPDIIEKFGGHAMAAGLSIQECNLEKFKLLFDQTIRGCLTRDNLEGKILTDGELTEDELESGLAEAIRDAGPWGEGFQEPVFDGIFEIVSSRMVGEKHLKLKIRCNGENKLIDAIAFNCADSDIPDMSRHIQIVYRLEINEYRGKHDLQLVAEHIEPVDIMS